ncbi:MAG: spore germination protein, partial [Eubacteriales bacterium]
MDETIYISRDLDANIAKIKELTLGSFDVITRVFTTEHGVRMCVVFIDGLVNKITIQDNVIRPLVEAKFRLKASDIQNIKDVLNDILSAGDVKEEPFLNTGVRKVMFGGTLLLMEGETKALSVETRGWQNRGIQQPNNQKSIRGPQEAFTETLLFNVGLMRRKLRSEKLKMEIINVGTSSKTDVCLAFMDGIADSGLVNTVRGRIQKVRDVDYLTDSGQLEQLIEDKPGSLFGTVGINEKPDIVAAKLMEGRIAILVDGTPFVLTVPMLFIEGFHAVEDYYMRPFYANVLRVLRVFAYIVTLLLPAVYIALVNFHQEMIPEKLLFTIIKARDGIPFPSFLELLLMLVLYEIIREAVLRLPTVIGSTIGIVGGLIIGQAAISAGIVGGPVVVVAAITFITSAVMNPALDSVIILRVILFVLAGVMGIFGILLGLFGIFVHLCSLESFGVPYMMPVAPVNKKGLRDAVVRFPIKDIIKMRSGKIVYRKGRG